VVQPKDRPAHAAYEIVPADPGRDPRRTAQRRPARLAAVQLLRRRVAVYTEVGFDEAVHSWRAWAWAN
jgi:hypothetical protein